MLKKIKSYLKKVILNETERGHYFSQSGEDAIIKTFFYEQLENKQHGFYVDVGAFHPTNGSNTYYYYLNGWRGINIDAAPNSMEAFRKIRPRDINLEVGVGLRKEKKIFHFMEESSSMNSFSDSFINERNLKAQVSRKIEMTILPLSDILDEHLPPNTVIDFLSVDVEGLDLEVLMSNNWEKYTPRVVLVEMKAQKVIEIFDNEITKFLQDKGYEPYAKTLLSGNLATTIFAHNSFFV